MIHPTKPAPTIDVPFPEELIGSRVVIQGASGAGKAYAIRRILESTHARMQHFVLDSKTNFSRSANASIMSLLAATARMRPLAKIPPGNSRALLELGVSACDRVGKNP
jgi:hypothetical protein